MTAEHAAESAERALLERRARRLAAPPETADEGALLWLAEFTVADHSYAVHLGDLLGTVTIHQARALPLAPPEVIGVLRWQGAVITAFSLGSLLGVRGWHADPRVLLVVKAGEGRVFAFDCETIPRPAQCSEALLRGAEPVDPEGALVEIVEASRTVRLIDVRRLVRRT